MTSTQLAPAILIPFVVWRIYVRARRNIGRQPLRPAGLAVRLAIYTGIVGLVTIFAAPFLTSLEAEVGGLIVGVALAVLGLRLTRWEMTSAGNFYTPNALLGIGLTLLFVGRLVYRFTVLLANPPEIGAPPPPLFQSPLTLLIFGVTAGYYLAYTAGVLVRGRRGA
ncbi:MAG: hypothetical protein KF715_03475 [Candidatus Didemnitutus sp.]|nr:hypothetical protein [Candidatus Didemnitutus sp.]